MKIIGHGIDLASAGRLKAILEKDGDHFEKRVFSAGEDKYCRSRKDPYPSFAARFAAKEAYGKAMGLGLGATGDFVEVEVVLDGKGAPTLLLSGRANEIFREKGGKEIFLSLSHEGDLAIASVILVSDY